MAPPQVADRALHRDPVGPVVVEARHSAVDLARREDEAASLGQRDDFFHQLIARDGQASSLLPTRASPAPAARGPKWTRPTSPHGGEAKADHHQPSWRTERMFPAGSL